MDFKQLMQRVWKYLRMGKFYAVYKGRKPGVYKTWNDCKNEVDGFKGSVYKSFATNTEAQSFAKAGKVIPLNNDKINKPTSLKNDVISCEIDQNTLMEIFGNPSDDDFSDSDSKVEKSSKKTIKRKLNDLKKMKGIKRPRIVDSIQSQSACKTDVINGITYNLDEKSNPVVYTDGACSNNGKKSKIIRAGYGVWWGDLHPLNLGCRLEGIQTNQRAEIAAVNACIKQAIDNKLKSITIRTDSMFVINCVTKWVQGWLRRNWIKADGKPVIHKNEFLVMLENLKKVKVNWEHVRGHHGIYGNEMADKLAVNGAKL